MATINMLEETANYLLNHCFVLGGVEDQRAQYLYVQDHLPEVRAVFKPLGYAVLLYPAPLQAAALVNEHEGSQARLLKYESILLLVLRLFLLQNCLQVSGQLVNLCLCIFQTGSLYAHIEFNLGLGSGRTCTAPGIVGQFKVQNVGLGKSGRANRAGCHIFNLILIVVAHLYNLQVAEILRRIAAKLIHHCGDLGCAVDSLQSNSILSFFVVAIFLIQRKHLIPAGHAVLLAPVSYTHLTLPTKLEV